jgi:hypothetical protein
VRVEKFEWLKNFVILSEGEVLRTAASFLRSITVLRRSEPQSKASHPFQHNPQEEMNLVREQPTSLPLKRVR